MTPTEINQRIAGICGWIDVKERPHPLDEKIMVLSGRRAGKEYELAIPDYYNSLDACHEMEKAFTPQQWRYYFNKLMVAVRDADLSLNGSNIEARYKTAHATSQQRCMGFLKVFGEKKGEV